MTKMTPTVSLRWALVGVGAVATLALAGCGDASGDAGATTSSTVSTTTSSTSSPSTTSTASSSSSSSSSSPAGRTLEVTVTGRTVDPAPSTVRLGVGERLTLTVTSDHDDTLHIHGFEVEEELRAGVPSSVTLTGRDPGVYEVETHHPELRLLKIAVQ